jgi:hypothetical protein
MSLVAHKLTAESSGAMNMHRLVGRESLMLLSSRKSPLEYSHPLLYGADPQLFVLPRDSQYRLALNFDLRRYRLP